MPNRGNLLLAFQSSVIMDFDPIPGLPFRPSFAIPGMGTLFAGFHHSDAHDGWIRVKAAYTADDFIDGYLDCREDMDQIACTPCVWRAGNTSLSTLRELLFDTTYAARAWDWLDGPWEYWDNGEPEIEAVSCVESNVSNFLRQMRGQI